MTADRPQESAARPGPDRDGPRARRRIDLTADLGEGFGPWRMGDDAALLDVVTSASIACGGHAGDPEIMFSTLTRAAQLGVCIGAHPGFADREGFGRRIIPMPPDEAARLVASQVGSLQALATMARARVSYVKLHGALANLAADDVALATAIVAAVRMLPGDLAILAISGTALEQAAQTAGVPVFSEVFADRAYLSSGRLVPRSDPAAMIRDPDDAVARLRGFLDSGLMPVLDGPPVRLAADSVCVHGDTPGALGMARAVRAGLHAAGVTLAPFLPG